MATYTMPPGGQSMMFSPVLDGSTYSATTQWNMFGQRWFLNISTLAGELVALVPVVGSSAFPVNLVAGYFTTSTLTFDDGTNTFTVLP